MYDVRYGSDLSFSKWLISSPALCSNDEMSPLSYLGCLFPKNSQVAFFSNFLYSFFLSVPLMLGHRSLLPVLMTCIYLPHHAFIF